MTTPEPRTTTERTLARLLDTESIDAGCEKTLELLHVYVERVIDGVDPEVEFPGITAHLRTCGPCVEDFEGLMNAVRAELGDA